MVRRLRVVYAESAVRDLEDIRDYHLDQQVPEVGERLIGEIVALIAELPVHPDRGRVVPEFN